MKNEPDIVIRIPIRALRALLAEVHDHQEVKAAFTQINAEPAAPDQPPPESRPWTERQKRFLYRLLQRLGREGEAAKDFIRSALQPNDTAPTRQEASQLIEQLQADLGKEGQGDHRDAA